MFANDMIKNKVTLLSAITLGAVAITHACADQWIMHHIDPKPDVHRYCGYNSLGPADFNQDGYTDYLVIQEFGVFTGLTLLLHPGTNDKAIYDYWQKVEVLQTEQNEHANVGDFDGDGNLDLVSVEGSEHKDPSRVRILWGPEPKEIANPENWKLSKTFAALDNVGNPHYSDVRDIDGDGDLDIFVGGRQNPKNDSLMGIHWIENPGKNARDIDSWTVHEVDAKLWSGHGFRFFDLDEDGDQDILINNADFNTPTDEIAIMWYENTPEALAGSVWPRHIIDTSEEYFYKVKVAAGDLDGDGLTDLVCPIRDDRIAFFRKKSADSLDYEKIIIEKRGDAVQLQRFVEVVDINGDGQMDILCGNLHYFGNNDYGFPQRNGYIEPQKYLVFWMEYTGDKPGADNWVYHPIKLSYGYNTGREWRGEKIDNVLARDMDGDGDLDVIVNSEESFINMRGRSNNWQLREASDAIFTSFGVAWFENAQTQVVASDDFESGGLEGGTGWSAPWFTQRQAIPTEEYVLEGEYSLKIPTNVRVSRRLPEKIYEGQLEFRWKGFDWDPGDMFTVEVFDGKWHNLRTYYNDEEEPGIDYRNEMLSFSKYNGISRVRFVSHADDENDLIYIDSVIIKEKVE